MNNIVFEHVVKAYGKNVIVNDLNMEIREGERLILLGPSGCGKSTMLRLLAGLDQPTEGAVYLDGEKITRPNYDRGLVFQDPNLFPWLNIYDNISSGLRARHIFKQKRDSVREFMDRGGLTGLEKSYPHQLSGGQQQRVAIARALALHPDILCFDEPTSALDPELTGEVLRVLRDLADRKTTMIIVTHEMHFARGVADRIMFMDGGVVVEEGPAKQLIEHPQEERTKQFLAHYSE